MWLVVWLAEVEKKVRRKNQILFSRESLILVSLSQQLRTVDKQTAAHWALELAEQTVAALEESCPGDTRPAEAVAAARSWLAGEIKLPIAKQAILSCHAMAKELDCPVNIALCHAIGQACSVIHTVGHALGYPMYELTAIVRREGIPDCRDAVEARVQDYERRLSAAQNR